MTRHLLLSLILLISFNHKTFACDCSKILSKEDSKLIFTGEVLGVQGFDEPYRFYEITFKVLSKEKGNIKGDTVVICTPCLNAGCCGIEFENGKKFEVYTFERHERDYTNICTQTRQIK